MNVDAKNINAYKNHLEIAAPQKTTTQKRATTPR
jgi:hypothetical protein